MNKEEFIEQHCRNCGNDCSQKCEGVYAEWCFDGCKRVAVKLKRLFDPNLPDPPERLSALAKRPKYFGRVGKHTPRTSLCWWD